MIIGDLTNRRGQTVKDRITEEFNYIKTLDNIEERNVLATKALGAADIAVEFGLITYTEWEAFVSEYFTVV